jgi:organic hydroperoxide reductase OsmC/OhrA
MNATEVEPNADGAGVVRHATIRWLESPPHGVARVHVDSHAFKSLPLSIRPGDPSPGKTTPGELLAAAVAAFMATRVAQRLERDGSPPLELGVSAWCFFSHEAVDRFEVEVHGRVPGVGDDAFSAAVQAERAPCGQALGLRDDLQLELRASLWG